MGQPVSRIVIRNMRMQLVICSIRTDGGTQPRETIDFVTVADYADDMRAGAIFPPVVVFNDGADYWLADGFHRLRAAEQAGLDEIRADVRQGTQQDAQWYSYSVNAKHGMRRSSEDKRRAVEAAMAHPYASRHSTREIATHCGVSHMTVQRYREDICNNVTDTRLVTRNGRTYEMNTANIGRAPIDINSDEICDLFDSGERAEMTLMSDREIRIEVARRIAERAAGVDDGNFHDRNEWTGDERLGVPTLIPLLADEDEEEERSCYGSCIHAVVLTSDYDRFFCKKYERDYHMQQGWELAPTCPFYTDEELSIQPAPASMTQPMILLTSQETVEWYTPPNIIERARAVLGEIDLDPASSDVAQQWIKAARYYTLDTTMQQPWAGRVWLNPPFDDTPTWVDRLDGEYLNGDVTAAVLLVNSAPGYIWWEDLWRRRPVCLLRERLCFWTPESRGGGPAKKGTTIAYYGDDVAAFKKAFGDLGRIILPEY